MIINSKDIIQFAKLSKDKNKIHLDRNFSSKFFFKEPIAQGVNIALLALSLFFKKHKGFIFIKNISINFKNYLLVNEKFKIKILKKRILVFNELNRKLEINIEWKNYKQKDKAKFNFFQKRILKKYQIKNLINTSLINELMFVSYYIGSIKPGNGSLIHKIDIENTNENVKKSKIKFKKKVNNVYSLSYLNEFNKVNVILSKLPPFKPTKSKSGLSFKSLNNLNKKKILILGSSSDIARRLILDEIKKRCKLFFYSFRINFNKLVISKNEINRLKKQILKIKPNFIFYLSSPKIYYGEKKNKMLFKYYKIMYVHYFKNILKIIQNNKIQTKIFYPSTIYLNNKNKYKRLECYLMAKAKAEEMCESKRNRKLVTFFRIPQLISRSNYNMLGFYEGQNLKIVDKYLDKFFKKATY